MKRGFGARALHALAGLLFIACSKETKPSPEGDRAAPSSKASSSALTPAARAEPVPSSVPNAPKAPAGPRNVVLITIDSLRADVPWAGYPRPTAPNLTRLAESSAVYTNAYSASSYTAKSVATLLSGRYASTLFRDGFFFAKYASSNRMLAEVLAERQIASIGFHGHLYFGRGKGLEQGFSTWELVPGISFDPETDNYVTSDKMTALGMKLLGDPKNTGKQFFAWAHYMDPHDQYIKHKEAPDFGNKGRDKYDSEVWFADHWIGELLTWAEQQPWFKSTVWIVSADHGEAFGEHGMYRHAFELWEVLTRVPLLVHGPGISPSRIDLRRSHIDVAPTILELMGVPIPEGFQGKSLVPELEGKPPESREPILLELTEDSHNPPRRALIEGDYKIIDFGRSRFELYDLKSDPGEEKDLVKTKPDELGRMRSLLEQKFGALPSVAPYGGMKLKEGGTARGPVGPAK